MPNGTISSLGISWPIGFASPADALADSDDGSAIQFSGVSPYLLASITDYTIGANQRIRAMRVMNRDQNVDAADVHAYLEDAAGNQLESGSYLNLAVPYFYSTMYGNWMTTRWVTATEWTQADLNAVRMRLKYDTHGVIPPNGLFMSKAWVDIDVLSKSSVVVTGPTGTLNTRFPIVKWTPILPDKTATYWGGPLYDQKKFRVKAFTAAQYTAGGFDPATSASYYDSGVQTGAHTTWQIDGLPLPDGSIRFYVQIATDFNGSDWWSDWSYSTGTVSDLPIAPVVMTPKQGAVVSTDVPILTVLRTPTGLGYRVRGEWQVATDGYAMSVNLRTVTSDTTDLGLGGYSSKTTPDSLQLFQGQWWLRARLIDEFGGVGPWGPTWPFTVSHAPAALPISPKGNASLASSAGNYVFAWSFTDPSPVDFQTQYQVIVERNSDGLQILDTGIVVSGVAQVATPINQAYKDTLLRWKVRVWDSDAVASDWSDYATFYYRDTPTVVITSPSANGATVQNPQPQVTWTFNAAGGRTQAEYRVVFSRPNGWTFDSGWQAGSVTSYRPPNPILSAPISDYSLTISVRDNTGLQGSSVRTFVTAWTAPAAPAPVIDPSGYDTLGFVRIQWSNASKDATWVAWRVYRKLASDATWTLLYETRTDAANYEYDDWTPGANQQYEYCVVQVATRFGMEVESVYNYQSIIPSGENYWLIDPADPAMSVRLRHVKEDSFSEEFEQEELLLIGRGRKTDYGTRWGYVGSLTANITDEGPVTARSQRLSLEALRNNQSTLLLRNPFGDVWQVASGNMGVQRTAGVGQREYVSVTIPYSEQS